MIKSKYIGDRENNEVEAVSVASIFAGGDGVVASRQSTTAWAENLKNLPKWVTDLFARGVFRLSTEKAGLHIHHEHSYEWGKMDQYIVWNGERAVVWSSSEFQANFKLKEE